MTDYSSIPTETPFNKGKCTWCGVTEGICGNIKNRKPGERMLCWRFTCPTTIEKFEELHGKEPPEEDNEQAEAQQGE